MKSKIYIMAAAGALAVACTDLDEEVFSVVPASQYGTTSDELKTIAGSAYASLRGFNDGVSLCYPTSEYVYFLLETVSDELIVPQRGADWFDNGRYQDAHIHDIKPDNSMVLGGWKYCYAGISTCNFIIYSIEQAGLSPEDEAVAKAEIRGIRAYYYYLLLDWFGNVPIVTSFTDEELVGATPRDEVFEFVENELLEIIDLLQPQIEYGRFTQNVGNTLLARLYINAEVFTGTAMWDECINTCDNVGGYTLTGHVLDNFTQQNETSGEIIFAIPFDHKEGTVGNYLLSLTYHYNQWEAFASSPGDWSWSVNGPCATPGIYSSFETGDERIRSLCYGPQISVVTGDTLKTRTGAPLIYTEEVTSMTDAQEHEGCRIAKFETKAGDVGERDYDWVVMRYAEVMMMKAECLVRLGRAGEAYPLVAELRNRSGVANTPNPVTLELMDQEWLHEFVFEGLRRSVNIRFGTYFQPYWEKPETTPLSKAIYPIPATELEKNQLLVQNPGY